MGETTCSCGKIFIIHYKPDYVYKIGQEYKTSLKNKAMEWVYYCSYSCFREAQKEKENKRRRKSNDSY